MSYSWPEIFRQKLHEQAAARGAENMEELAYHLSAITKQSITSAALYAAVNRNRSKFKLGPTHTLFTPETPELPGEPPDKPELPTREPKHLVELQSTRRNATAARSELRLALHELEQMQEQLRVFTDLQSMPMHPTPIVARHALKRKEVTMVSLASDWHVEEQVLANTVNGRNTYNLDIADERIKRFFQINGWLAQHHRNSFTIENMVLWLGGDLLTGYIHEELEESNPLSPTETILWLQERLIAGIEYLLTLGLKLRIPCNYGNHGRTTKKRRIATGAKNSYEWMMYMQLARYFANNPMVEFTVATGDHIYLDVYEFTLRFTHGDNFKYGGGVGGLSIPLVRGITRLENFQHADITNLGHFHQFKDFGDIVVNGSLIGYGPYALSINAPFEAAQQGSYLVAPGLGKCMVTPVRVQ